MTASITFQADHVEVKGVFGQALCSASGFGAHVGVGSKPECLPNAGTSALASSCGHLVGWAIHRSSSHILLARNRPTAEHRIRQRGLQRGRFSPMAQLSMPAELAAVVPGGGGARARQGRRVGARSWDGRAAARPRCACASRRHHRRPQLRRGGDVAPRRVERDADLKPVVVHGAHRGSRGAVIE
jgi:hypothetical protein